jgi:hypothetical protein
MKLYAVTSSDTWSLEYDMTTVSIHSTKELAEAAVVQYANPRKDFAIVEYVLDELETFNEPTV